jgi:acyl-CoA thioester hydrolase
MARNRIALPEKFSFHTTIPIRITDINYGNHVGNDSLLSIIHEARIQFLKSHGYSEMNLEGVSLIMSDVSIEFKAEVFYGDVITVSVTATEFTRVSFDLIYKLVTGEEKIVAVAKTGMVCFDYGSRKVAAVPDEVKIKLKD